MSPLLADALDALYQREADVARMARVTGRLARLLDAPPSAAGGLDRAARSTDNVSRLGVALKLMVGALLGLSPALWLTSDRSARRTSVVMQPAAAPQSIELPVDETETVAVTSNSSETRIEAAPGNDSRAASGPPTAAPSMPLRTARSGPMSIRHPSRARTDVELGAPAESVAGAVESGESTPEPPSAAVPSADSKRREPVVTAPAASRPASSELELLLSARNALTIDAARALHLLAVHAARYPHGLLTLEREVLAIDALERLGRAEEAKSRRTRFEQRYPASFHNRKHSR